MEDADPGDRAGQDLNESARTSYTWNLTGSQHDQAEQLHRIVLAQLRVDQQAAQWTRRTQRRRSWVILGVSVLISAALAVVTVLLSLSPVAGSSGGASPTSLVVSSIAIGVSALCTAAFGFLQVANERRLEKQLRESEARNGARLRTVQRVLERSRSNASEGSNG